MLDIPIIYQDNHLFIVNKPAGLLTQPNDSNENSLLVLCKQMIAVQCNKPGAVYLEAVHRIDKQVSGIVVFARTSKALTRLNASMRNKEHIKKYVALIENPLKSPQGILEDYLMHDDYKAAVVHRSHPNAKQAILKYQQIKSAPKLYLLTIELVTGRYHQIRIQLASRGSPIYGDSKYGSKQSFQSDAIALHHAHMQLQHPTLNTLISLHAPLPDYWPVDSKPI